MGDLIALMILGLATAVTTTALFALLFALFPRSVAEARSLFEIAPRRCFWFGLINLALFLLLTVIMLGIAESSGSTLFVLLAMGIATPAVIGILLGLTGIARVVGERLVPARSERDQLLSGALTLILASMTPFLGWFAVLPLLATSALGASVLAFVQRYQSPKSV